MLMKTKVCKPQLGKTDLTRISKMTEDELEQNARADFDGLNLRLLRALASLWPEGRV